MRRAIVCFLSNRKHRERFLSTCLPVSNDPLFDIVNIHLLAGDAMPDDGLRSGQRTIHAANLEWSRRPFETFERPLSGVRISFTQAPVAQR